jgi:hypothetical protein
MSIEDRKEKNIIDNSMFSISSSVRMIDQPRCHRGLDLRVWLNKNSTKNTCLCPLSYYGEQCQYQNQRIGLTIRFRALSDSSQTLFTIVVSLIDDSNDRIIHSYEQIIYLLMKHCKTKFSIPLLYSTRPKDPTKNYAIHIDFYEKVPLVYRGSVLLPIRFPFLPVHRLAFIIDIPGGNQKIQSCINDQCLHGKCIKYSNNQDNYTFCQCDRGWTGKYCSIQHICTCSSDSLCIGISANNRSICVCPTNKFGPRCLLNETFSGDRCEIADTKLNLLFDKDLVLSQSIFIHFIEIMEFDAPVRSTRFRTIPLREDSLTIHWSQTFHLVFIEPFNNTYYLTVNQAIYNQSAIINKTINRQ